jgi:hypothetical protein
MVSKFWEKYFHLCFKVLGLTHFKLATIQRYFLHIKFQKLSYFKHLIFIININITKNVEK